MLDSPNYIGTASKGYGFKANWARTLPMVPTVDPKKVCARHGVASSATQRPTEKAENLWNTRIEAS